MSNELAKVDPKNAALAARPAFIPYDQTGTENIANEDIQIPRLALAQKMSPQVDNSTPKYIDGLEEGMLFNSLTNEVYGEGPITFAVIRIEKPRAVEFYPIGEGGGVKDPNVPLDDPRLQFVTDPTTGKTTKPVAMKFYDFIIAPVEADGTVQVGDVMALSLKSTGVKVAKQLNGLIKMRRAPLFSGLYTLTVKKATNKTGQVYHTFAVTNAGWVTEETNLAILSGLYEAFSDAVISIDREVGADDMEGETTAHATGETSPSPF